MRVIVNGEMLEQSNAATVSELLRELHINSDRVAVEVNLAIVKKEAFSTFRLNEGDKVEIVNFVGGG
jgi:sulfur carrier protein